MNEVQDGSVTDYVCLACPGRGRQRRSAWGYARGYVGRTGIVRAERWGRTGTKLLVGTPKDTRQRQTIGDFKNSNVVFLFALFCRGCLSCGEGVALGIAKAMKREHDGDEGDVPADAKSPRIDHDAAGGEFGAGGLGDGATDLVIPPSSQAEGNTRECAIASVHDSDANASTDDSILSDNAMNDDLHNVFSDVAETADGWTFPGDHAGPGGVEPGMMEEGGEPGVLPSGGDGDGDFDLGQDDNDAPPAAASPAPDEPNIDNNDGVHESLFLSDSLALALNAPIEANGTAAVKRGGKVGANAVSRAGTRASKAPSPTPAPPKNQRNGGSITLWRTVLNDRDPFVRNLLTHLRKAECEEPYFRVDEWRRVPWL